VSVSPDGLHAAVGHDGYVSYVRLSPAPVFVEKVIPTTANVLDVVLAGNGWIYAFPKVDQWETIRCLQISTAKETLSTGYSIYAGTKAKLHPGGGAIYGADNGISPSDIEKYGISSGTASYLYDSPYHGAYAMCGDLWISEDGLRIVTACGNTFHANTTKGDTAGSDMTYAGKLEGLSSLQWADHSLASGQILAVPRNGYFAGENADETLRVFGNDYLALEETIPLPRIGVGGKGYVSHGRFAFHSQDGTRRHAVVAVDSSAGLLTPYAVVSY
jgi:chitinase